MDFQAALEHRAQVEAFQRKHRTALLTLLFTDLVGSTRLKHDLGDSKAVALMQQHHALLRDILGRFPEAEEISVAGDSFFLVFTKPSDAVKFSLLLQHQLRALARDNPHPLLERIGIHVGEVIIEENADAAQPKNLYGIQVDTCARVMSLAEAGQILLPRAAFDSARQVLKGRDIEGLGTLSWLNHGPYVLKGVEEPLEICEVGETGAAPLKPPPDSEKVHRHVSPDSEPVLGWRPAIGQIVPNTRWMLEEKLGEGGFGEVWLGRHETLKERRVFKFCFRADRVRSLRREVTLFRVLKEKAGEHPHIVAVEDVYFDEPPYYLMMEYVPGRDLPAWCEAQGGSANVPVDARLEIVAQMAEALQDAHEAGVIHRDVKPSNILVSQPSTPDSQLLAKLTDFGIGQVMSQEVLAGMTRLGFTQTMMTSGSQSGSQMYMAPELLAGQPASPRSDLYSLGVVLYQLLAGDFARPVTTDWAKAIEDPLLREDLQQCFAGDVRERFGSAGQLAVNLRSLAQRRVKRAAEQAAIAARERAAYRRGLVRATAVGAAIVAVMAGLLIFAVRQTKVANQERDRARTAEEKAEEEKENTRQALAQAQIALAEAAYREGDATTMQTALNAVPDDLRDSNWNYLLEKSDTSIATLSSSSSVITHMAPHPKQPGVFAAVSYNGQVEFVVVRTGLRLLKFQAGFKQKFNSEFWTAFSPDGERLAIGRADGGIAIHSARDGKKLMEWDTDHIKGLQFSPDGRQLLERERDNDYFSLWDTATGQLLWKTSKRGRAVFNPSGQFILVAFDDKLKLLNPKDGSVLREVADVRGGANSIAIRLDGNRALVGQQNGFVRCVDLKEGRVLFETRVASRSVWAIAYTTDGSRFVTRTALSGNRPSLQVWDAESGKPLQTLLGGGIGSFYNFWISIHPLSGEFMSNGSPIKVWDVNGGQSAKWRFNSHNGTRNVAFWRTDDMVFVNRFGDDSTRVLDLNLKEPLDQPLWRGESKKLHNVSVSADGRFAVVGRQQPVQVNFLRLNGSSVEQVYTPNLKNQIIHALALSPAGDRLWLNDSVIDPSTGAELLCVNSDEIKRFNCARWLNNTQVVTAVNAKAQRGRPNSEEQLILWDATTGQRLRSVTYPSYIFALAVAPDGKTFAEAGGDKMVRLRDAATLEVLDEFRAHDDAITALAFHPNRPILATGSADLTIKLWDLDTGRQLDELHGHTAPLQDVAFSPSGRRLASLSANDRATRIWEPESLNPDAAKAKVSADGWEDLLAQLKRDDVAKTGNGWQFNNGALFSPNRRNATIALPGKFAQSSYQVRVKLRQLTPKESLHILLPVADHQTSFMLDGYPQEGYWSCLHIIKGVNEKSQPETVKGKVVKDSELHELELTVQLEGSNVQFRAFLDDEPLYQWSGPADSLIQQEAWQITPPDVIALGAHNANWLVYAVKVKRLEK